MEWINNSLKYVFMLGAVLSMFGNMSRTDYDLPIFIFAYFAKEHIKVIKTKNLNFRERTPLPFASCFSV